MKDIAPELLERLKNSFRDKFNNNEDIKRLNKLLATGNATHQESHDFALIVGEILAEVYQENIAKEMLPEGRMWYNIAEKIIKPTMDQNYQLISAFGSDVQSVLNKKAGFDLKGIKPELNQDRIDGLINKLSEADDYDKVKWLLGEPIVNFSQSIVDDVIKENADRHYQLGLKAKIIRKAETNCCSWCSNIEGVYNYPDVPQDVYRRHRYCRCTVDYIPADGRRQNVHSKKWEKNLNNKVDTHDIMKKRSKIALEITNRLKANNVIYNPVTKLTKNLSTDEIINRLGGGDMTKGSCSSLAFCYIGNKNGMDVLDFRGGNSQLEFSLNRTIKDILKLPDVKGSITEVEKEIKGTMEILKNLEIGKEYYLATGKHAAIVRNIEEGLQYLELQSAKQNGWTSFKSYGSIEKTLSERFGCRKTADKSFGILWKKKVILMEVDSFRGNTDFEEILGYINTAVDAQKKGVSGSVK